MSKLLKAIKSTDNVTFTENNAKTLKSTLNAVLDLFSRGAAMRTSSEDEVVKLFATALAEDRELALKCLFYIRDIRAGQGERRFFRVCMRWLANSETKQVVDNLELFSEFGRWDDLLCLLGTKAEKNTLALIKNQLMKDIKSKKPSLLARHLPSENASSKETIRDAKIVREFMGMDSKKYRKTLSKLRKALNVVECLMCSGEWGSINYERVPSRASMIYRKAFGRNDTERYVAYLGSVEKGEAKINSGVLYPYDIVTKIINGQGDQTLEAQWKALPNYFEGAENQNSLCICDVSGSMAGLPLAVSISLGLYAAEHNVGPFKDHFITFSAVPTLQKVVGNTLQDRVNFLSRAAWDMNTDLQAVFDLVLSSAVKHKVPKVEMPSLLFIISDMEFDQCCSKNKKSNFEAIAAKYRAAKYKMPTLCFWNVNARNQQSPVKYDERGCFLISGCSSTTFKNALNTKATTPQDLMLEVLSSERYSIVKT